MRSDEALLAAFGLEELLPRSNGYHAASGHEATCRGCGLTFLSARRPSPTRHSWCYKCRKEGKPNAQRQAEFRARRQNAAQAQP